MGRSWPSSRPPTRAVAACATAPASPTASTRSTWACSRSVSAPATKSSCPRTPTSPPGSPCRAAAPACSRSSRSATYNIDPARLEAAISPRTKAILPVHLYGQPADMDPINAVARKHGLRVLDDCAQAHAARYKGRPVGSPRRALGVELLSGQEPRRFGDAGAVTSDDAALAEQVRVLATTARASSITTRSRASIRASTRSRPPCWRPSSRGWSSRPSAAVRSPRATATACAPAAALARGAVVRRAGVASLRRSPRRSRRFQQRLSERGIGTLIHYPVPPHLQPAYAELGWDKGRFPISEAMHAEVLSLPMWPGLDDAAVEQVIDAVRACA